MSPPDHRPSVIPRGAALVLLVLGLAVRVAWCLVASTELWFDHIFNDATAWNLALGRGFTASPEAPFLPAVFRTPGYPAFLAGIYALAGHSVRVAFLANAVLDLAACAMAWRLAARVVGERTAMWVLALAVSYPFTVHAAASVSPESLLVLGAMAFLWTLGRWPTEGTGIPVLLSGLALGLLAWIKPVFLPLPLFLIPWERVRGLPWRRSLLRPVVVGAVAAVVFVPWLWRNVAAFGRPVLAGELGLVVWHGTRDFGADTPDEIRGHFERAPRDPELRYDRTQRGLADSEAVLARDREYLEQGLEILRERPLRALVLDPLRRVPRLWISTRHVQLPDWVGHGAFAACILYILLAAAGAWRLRNRFPEWAAWLVVPVTLTLAYAALHVEARYTIPARPILWFLGGAAIGGFLQSGKSKPG